MVPRLQGEALPPVLVINGDHPVDDRKRYTAPTWFSQG
jgi:hypothetical protein